jgi:hypothetical protein
MVVHQTDLANHVGWAGADQSLLIMSEQIGARYRYTPKRAPARTAVLGGDMDPGWNSHIRAVFSDIGVLTIGSLILSLFGDAQHIFRKAVSHRKHNGLVKVLGRQLCQNIGKL